MLRLLLFMGLALPFHFAALDAQSQPVNPATYDASRIYQERFTDTDRLFLQRAGQAHLMELQLAALAEKRVKDPRVRLLTSRLLRDHEIELAQLEQLATERGVKLPDITEIQQQTVERLQALEGDAFDRALVQQIINEHQDQIALYSDVSENPNLEIRMHAEKRLVTIKEHLRRAREIYPLPLFARWGGG